MQGQPPSPSGAPMPALVQPPGPGPVATSPPEGWVELPRRGVVALAPYGRRAAARGIDMVVVAAMLPVLPLLGGLTGRLAGRAGAAPADLPLASLIGSHLGGLAGVFLAGLLVGVFALVYETVTISLWGRTLGKFLMGIAVVRVSTGRRPDCLRSLLRYLVPGLLTLIPMLGQMGALACWLSALIEVRGRRQGWHDMLAGTCVIRARGARQKDSWPSSRPITEN